MFRNCLIGSICFHILILVGVGLCLPRPSHPLTQTAVYFDILGNGGPDRASSGVTAKGPGGKPAGDSSGLVMGSGTGVKPSRRPQAVPPGPAEPRPDPITSPDQAVVTEIGEETGAPKLTESPGTRAESGDRAGVPGIGTSGTMAGGDGDGSIDRGESGDPTAVIYGSGGLEGAAPEIPPQKILQVAPVYPEAARRNNWEGDTVLQALISRGGVPGSITVLSSSGHPLLDRAAVGAVRRWRFRPAYRGGEPVVCYIMITIHFKLED